jgi:hypothetical protein
MRRTAPSGQLVSLPGVAKACSLALIGVTGGALITEKVAGEEAAYLAFFSGIAWVVIGTSGLLLLLKSAKRRAIANGFFVVLWVALGLNTFLLAIAAPLLWSYSPLSTVGTSLWAYTFVVLAYQLWRGYCHFSDCWSARQASVLSSVYQRTATAVDVEGVVQGLQVKPNLFLPRSIAFLENAISAALIASMLIGLSFRKLYPEGSAFAWGIPALTIVAVGAQIAFIRALLTLQLWRIEKQLGIRLSSIVRK